MVPGGLNVLAICQVGISQFVSLTAVRNKLLLLQRHECVRNKLQQPTVSVSAISASFVKRRRSWHCICSDISRDSSRSFYLCVRPTQVTTAAERFAEHQGHRSREFCPGLLLVGAWDVNVCLTLADLHLYDATQPCNPYVRSHVDCYCSCLELSPGLCTLEQAAECTRRAQRAQAA